MNRLVPEIVYEFPFQKILLELNCHDREKLYKECLLHKCCKKEIAFNNFIDYYVELPEIGKNLIMMIASNNSQKELVIFDTGRHDIIDTYKFQDEVISYYILGNKLLFCATGKDYFKIFLLYSKYKLFIHHKVHKKLFFQTEKNFMILLMEEGKESDHLHTLEIYDYNFELKGKIEITAVRCLCHEGIMIVQNKEKYDYYDLNRYEYIEKGLEFYAWYKDMIIDRADDLNGECKNVVLKKFVEKKEKVPKHLCYICHKDFKNDCVVVPCGHTQFHKECVGKLQKKICPMCEQKFSMCLPIIM
jgi:hypothetical protein